MRRSSRTGKGNGGRLQQLHNIERIQTAGHVQSSTRTRNLDVATQGQAVNPMAPDYSHDDQESQIPPWWPSPESRVQDVPARPSFTHSQLGQPFGFKVPSQTTVSSRGGQSTNSHSSSRLSSHSLSVFSAPVSRGASSAPTSCVSSTCGSNSVFGTNFSHFVHLWVQ